MATAADLPLALYHANVRLQTRLGQLLQASSQHWLEFGQRLYQDGLSQTQAGASGLLQARDWQGLAALPADAFWRQLQQRFGDQQAGAQIAVAAQTRFAHGLQEALQAWQQETVQALESAGLSLPVGDPDWGPLFTSWEPLLGRAGRARARASRARPAPAQAEAAPGAATSKTPRKHASGAAPAATARTGKRRK